MKATDLRKSILQAAVQGKLVPQDKNDEPASELLKRIQAEKAVLIKEGKLKKEKPLPPITEDELPYELPEGWMWCRLGDLVSLYDGSIRRGPFGSAIRKDMFVPKSENTYKVYEQGNAIRKTIEYGNYYISDDHYAKLKSFDVIPGDIIISCAGTLGETYILPDNAPKGVINQALLKININHSIMSDEFFLVIFKAITQQQILQTSLGSAMKNLVSISWLKGSVMFPLPPLAEQQRIVAKVDELMAMCDELEAAEKELDALESHFFDYLPKSILQAAVQGKLVPQDKNDEPASELLKRIQAKKAVLIKEGKLKKEKPLPPITEDEIPYDLPEGWVWCRLGNIIFDNVGGGTPSKQHAEYWNGEIPWASVKDLNCDVLTQTQDHITQLGLENSTSNLIQPGAIIVCMRMGLGKIAVSKIAVAINQDLRALTLSKENVLPNYFIYWYKTLTIEGGGMTVKGITISELSRMLFPLPPLKEQQRIVAKVDELMALCDELKRVADQPINHDNVIPFPTGPKGKDEPIAMAARGEVEGMSDQAKQAIEDLFGEDE